MRSPADVPVRRRLEQALRGGGVLALLWLVFRAMSGVPAAMHFEARSSDLYAGLARWSSSVAPHAVHVEGDGVWDAAARDWLAALPGAGTRVSWSGAGPLPVAIAADPVADPEGATRASAAAPAGARMVLADQVGPLDSIQPAGGGARFVARSAPGLLTLATGSARAVSAVSDTLVLGRVLVIARAGWESKFVTAALEERGWTVDARLFLRPGRDVRQGPGLPLDTSRYAVVIVLDSGLAEPRAVSGYVRSGGGAILSMQATRDPGLASLAAGARGAEYPGLMPFDTAATEPLRSLALTPILPRNDAVVLERSGSRVAVAARRLERGRVLTFGYHDIWRWRMSGSDGAAQAHRDWWADLVSLVAQAGRVPVSDDVLTDEAPRAALAARLGSPGKGPADAPGPRWPGDPLLFGVALAALFSEWMSRRLRGAV